MGDPVSTKKSDMVAFACDLSILGVRGRRIVVQSQSRQSYLETLLEKQIKNKIAGGCGLWQSTCLASVRP
jgi:hypothetical protein